MTTEALNKATIYRLKDSVAFSENSIVSKVIAKSDKVNLTLFAFDKGQNLSRHSSPFNALIQILEGSARIEIGENSFELDEGQVIIMPADIPHAVESVTAFKMLLTMYKL